MNSFKPFCDDCGKVCESYELFSIHNTLICEECVYHETGFRISYNVKKIGGDYSYEGVIVSMFPKMKTNVPRLVVQDDKGRLFIHNMDQLKLI